MANNNHFELTLDTLAPVGSISGLGDYEKENKALVIDGGNATFKKVWFDQVAEPTKETEEYVEAEWEAKDLSVTSAFTTPGSYYYHLVLMDDVNNESEIYTLGPVYFDNVKPVVSNVKIKDSRDNYNNTNEVSNLIYSFEYTDADSGAIKAVISGEDIETFEIELVASSTSYTGTFSFKDGVEDGNKKISVTVYDRANNESIAVESNSILLDRVLDKPVLLIQDAEGTNLPEYINYREIKANLTVQETNIVGYKIWEGDSEPADYETENLVSNTAVNITKDLTLSAAEGEKVIHAKILDVAGNTQEAETKAVIVDSIKPTAELVSDKAIISKIEGYNKAILSFGSTADNEGGSGINYYQILRNDVEIASGNELPANYEITVGALEDGVYKYKLVVRDKALNESTSEEVTIKFDTTAPELAINSLNAWYTSQFDIAISYSDSSALTSLKVWTSTVALDTTIPDTAVALNPVTEIAKTNINWSLAESEANYMHVYLVDEVGNVAYAHAKFGYDSVAPVIKSAAFTKSAYPSTSAAINISYEDATSGVVQMRVSGQISDATAENDWETIVSTRQVTLTAGDGIKTVVVEIKDAAGLTSSKEITCELDTTYPAPSLILYEADKISKKPAYSQLPSFSVRLVIDNDDFVGGVQYKLYGDFNYGEQSAAGITKEDAVLADFIKGEGVEYMIIDNLYCTSGDGTKNIYVYVVDNAGNATTIITPATFVYDTTEPEVVISDIDYNRISKVHTERRNEAGIIVGKYADETNFTFTPDSVITEYKVCAYADASAAVAGSHEDAAIGTENGSINMAASGLEASTAVNCKIKGADYEAALGGEDNDGAHIVVVYVKDQAEHWSVAASFAN